MDHVSITTLWIALAVAVGAGAGIGWGLGTRNRQDAMRDRQTIDDALRLIDGGVEALDAATFPHRHNVSRGMRNFARAIRAEVGA